MGDVQSFCLRYKSFFYLKQTSFNKQTPILYPIFKIVSRIIYDPASLPAVTTAAVPTTELIAATSVVATTTNARPWIQVVPVLDPATVLESTAKDPAEGPVYIATDPAAAKLIS